MHINYLTDHHQAFYAHLSSHCIVQSLHDEDGRAMHHAKENAPLFALWRWTNDYKNIIQIMTPTQTITLTT